MGSSLSDLQHPSILHIQHVFLGAHAPGTELSRELRIQTKQYSCIKDLGRPTSSRPQPPPLARDRGAQSTHPDTAAVFPPDLGQVTFLFPPYLQRCDIASGRRRENEKADKEKGFNAFHPLLRWRIKCISSFGIGTLRVPPSVLRAV